MRGYETCREVDLPLPIEGIEQGDAERLGSEGRSFSRSSALSPGMRAAAR
jgi:hypothetical protein